MIVVDTSAILAYMNSADDHHGAVSDWLLDADDDLVTTPLIVAEVDYLVTARGGRAAVTAFRDDLVASAMSSSRSAASAASRSAATPAACCSLPAAAARSASAEFAASVVIPTV